MIKGSKSGGVARGDIVSGNCIHPNCLDASLKRSLSALNLATVCLLHRLQIVDTLALEHR